MKDRNSLMITDQEPIRRARIWPQVGNQVAAPAGANLWDDEVSMETNRNVALTKKEFNRKKI